MRAMAARSKFLNAFFIFGNLSSTVRALKPDAKITPQYTSRKVFSSRRYRWRLRASGSARNRLWRYCGLSVITGRALFIALKFVPLMDNYQTYMILYPSGLWDRGRLVRDSVSKRYYLPVSPVRCVWQPPPCCVGARAYAGLRQLGGPAPD